jgi:ectoine hydroxylase-related dioxygenase (phytanoyl-CoA dioxygenase family)
MWTESVERDGYGILPETFSGAEIDSLLEALSDSKLQRSRAGMRHILQHPAVADAAKGCILGAAREVLGPLAFPFRATLFDKSLAANWLVVWHQDTALPLLQTRHEVSGWGPWSVKEGITYAHAPAEALSQVLALRIHLDESSSGNGPLRVLPGTHTLGVLSDEAIEKLVRETQPVECAVRRGGVLAMRPLAVHASSKSRVATPRRVLHIEYAATSTMGDGLDLALA